MDNFDLRAYLTNNPLLKEKNIFEKFLDGETEYKTLNEFISSIKEVDGKVIDKAQNVIDDLNPEEEKIAIELAVNTFGNIVPVNNIAQDEFSDVLKSQVNKEYGKLADKVKKKVRVAKLLVGTLAAIVLANTIGNINGKNIPVKVDPNDSKAKIVAQMNQDLDRDLENTLGADEFKDAAAAVKQNKAFDVDPDNETHIQFDTGESDLSDDDKADIEKTVDAIAKQLKNNKGAKANIKVAAGASNQGDPSSNVDNKGGDLTKNRLDKTVKAVEDEIVKQGLNKKDVKVTPIKVDYKKSTETQANNNNKGQGANIGVDFETEEQQQATIKVADLLMNPPAPKNIPTGGEPGGEPTEPKSEPTSEPRPDVGPSTEKVTADQTEKDIQSAVSGQVNRNGQIATVLRTLNFDNLNIFKELGVDGVKSFSDNELVKIQNDPNSTDKAKQISAGILSIRKNPKTLLNKVSKALGVKFNDRAKAVQTAPGASGKLQAFAPKLAEIFDQTLSEAFVDDFISDEDIRKNKVAILALLGSMYATDSDAGSYLSILDVDKAGLTDAEKDQLTKLGFSPQAGGKNYVFLKSKTSVPTNTVPTLNQPKDPDSDKITSRVASSKPIQQQLNKINNADELADLIVNIANRINPDALTNPTAALTKLSTAVQPGDRTSTTFGKTPNIQYKVIKESADVDTIMKTIDQNPTLSNLLKNNINKPLEFVYTLVKAFLPYVNPSINYNTLKTALRKATDVLKQQKESINEVNRMQKLAGIKK